MTTVSSPLLSLILCSRNDSYMGNSRWRLETALNYVGRRIRALGRERDVEVLVADWGSEVPLVDVVGLDPAAARIVSFITVEPALARTLQGDSPFPEVLALNAAARRARGQYIGRIDQDTLVGERFLRWFFQVVEEGRSPDGTVATPEAVLLFANRRSLPYRLAVCCPPLGVLERFIGWFGSRLRVETGRVFYRIDVGIWLVHGEIWHGCGGYDERMIYMNDMEIDMATRLMTRYPMVDLGRLVGYDFYHLDHYHPRGSRSSATHRRVNGGSPQETLSFRANGDQWGLAGAPLSIAHASFVRRSSNRMALPSAAADFLLCLLFSVYTAARMALDRVIYPFYPVWKRRAAIAWKTVRGQPLTEWPGLLRRIWNERPSARCPSLGGPQIP